MEAASSSVHAWLAEGSLVEQVLSDNTLSGSTEEKVNIPADSSSELSFTLEAPGDARCGLAVGNFRFDLLRVSPGLASKERSLHGSRRLR